MQDIHLLLCLVGCVARRFRSSRSSAGCWGWVRTSLMSGRRFARSRTPGSGNVGQGRGGGVGHASWREVACEYMYDKLRTAMWPPPRCACELARLVWRALPVDGRNRERPRSTRGRPCGPVRWHRGLAVIARGYLTSLDGRPRFFLARSVSCSYSSSPSCVKPKKGRHR